MKEMVSASKDGGFLYGKLISGSLYNTDGSIGPALVQAYGAGVVIGQVKTYGAELDLLLNLQETIG